MANTNIFSANPTNFAGRVNPQPNVVSAMQNAIPQCNLIWVSGKDEVLSHPKSPNETLYFGSSGDDPIIWVRETDANGEIKNPLHKLVYTVEEEPFGPEAQFVTKEEHRQLFDKVNEMSASLEKLVELLK